MKNLIVLLSFLMIVNFASAQDTIRNKKNGQYFFKTIANCESTEVQDQSRTSTCWSFSSFRVWFALLWLCNDLNARNISFVYIVFI